MVEQIETIDTEARNNLWKRLSKNVSRSKIGAFARAMSKAFGRMNVCRGGKRTLEAESVDDFEGSLPSAPTKFVYPEGRFLRNSEILTQLQALEERWQKQTIIINRFKEKQLEEESVKYKAQALKDNITIIPTHKEDRFAVIAGLVEQLKRRQLDNVKSDA